MSSRLTHSSSRTRVIVWATLLAACGDTALRAMDGAAEGGRGHDFVLADAPQYDEAATSDLSADASSEDAGAHDAGEDRTLEVVSHTRELRAVWVATVFRLDFPSNTNLSPAQASAELSSIVDVAAQAGVNAIFFQVRPESDALYTSTLEPWSRFLSGTQGVNPGYDPLELLIDLAHARGLEVHAWMNPYRALVTAGSVTDPLHVTNLYPTAAITYNSAVTMDPSDTRVRNHVVEVVTDMTHRYDIDGVAFDDYFYPYPAGTTPFPDDASYTKYTGGGGVLSKSDWRRDNVNKLVSAVASAIHGEKSWVRFGVAPFGIYRPGTPTGVVGLDAYEVLSCDSVYWMNQGWVDYLAPQIYWTTDSAGQPFGALIDWWASVARPGRPVISSLALYKLGTTLSWTTNELETEVALTRADSPRTAGQSWFRYGFLRDDVHGEKHCFNELYPSPARPPVVPGAASAAVAPPSVTVGSGRVTLGHSVPTTIRGYAVYTSVGAAWEFSRWIPVGTTGAVPLLAGRYAISAIDRGGVESLGVSVVVP